MRQVVLASNNQGKAREIASLLEGLDIELIAQSRYDVPAVAETGLTFVENALIKARHACAHTGLAAIADDSGLEVDGLNGEPGVRSARYAGEDATDADNNRRLVAALRDVPAAGRRARYQCIVVYLRHAGDPTPLIHHGTWEGRVIETPRGDGGFGYDPHFYLSALGRTAAELAPAAKNRLSHRGKALRALAEALREAG